jgi:hypothetical protein
MDMTEMTRSNFCTRTEGDALHIKMYSRRVQIPVPADVRNLFVQRAWLGTEGAEVLQWRNGQPGFQTIGSYSMEAIPVKPGEMEIVSMFPGSVDPQMAPQSRTPFWAIARRGFCEVRDRSKPALDRLRELKKG